MTRWGMLVAVAALLGLSAITVQGQNAVEPGPTLASIRARGEVTCSVSQDLYGFGFLDPNTGEISGFDIDFCHALAAALFGDVNAVRFELQTVGEGELALLTGEVDILWHTVGQTLAADTAGQLEFGPPNFYSGQSIMALVEDNLTTWPALEGKIVCVLDGTPLENLDAAIGREGLTYEPLTFEAADQAEQAFLDGRCDALTADWVQLVSLRRETNNSSAYTVWEAPFTVEPLVPVYLYGDKQWGDIVQWIIYGLIRAEVLGISSENIDDSLESTDPQFAELLGSTSPLGSSLGLTDNFMVDVIRQVGNYGEIYDRHLGENSRQPIPLPRGLNNLWTDGGLLYAPPWD